MIIATAGHIDHGKTSLVKALTGVDTDRLPEEKARGLSIDLGFAYLPLQDGQLLGFVDVPGHERFVRNMLAGVCAVDYALLVVAADDGVMPQTLEHLHILGLLNVMRGAVAITKIDRVEPQRVREVAGALQRLLAATMPTSFPIMPVSTRSGAGMVELRSFLIGEAAKQVPRQSTGEYFRLAIDRAFVVSGAGTVVTGTVFAGSVRPNDKVLVSSHGAEVRVRGIEVHGSPAREVAAGQRCALNLSGIHADAVGRGDWVLHPAIHNPSTCLDARISLLPSESQLLKHWTPVHLHIGSAETMARVVIPGRKSIAPGTSGFARIVLSRPICALRLDRFILRDQSATRTLGGGVVLDPLAGPLRRRDSSYPARLYALEQATPQAALAGLIAVSDDGVDLDRFEKYCNLTPQRAAALYAGADLMQIGKNARVGMSPTKYAALHQSIVEALAQFHLSQQVAGQKVEPLRRALSPGMTADAFQSVLRALADAGGIEMDGATVRLPGHGASARPDDEKLWQAVAPVLEAAGFMPPSVRQLAVDLGLREDILGNFLRRKAGTGQIVKVTEDRFYLRATIARMASIARAIARTNPERSFTVAQCRDASGAGRQSVINVLEFLDRLGITQRAGDVRRLLRDYVPIFGAGLPATEPPGPVADAAPFLETRQL